MARLVGVGNPASVGDGEVTRLGAALRLLLAAVLVGGSVGVAARANADPVVDYTIGNAGRVCKTLDMHPTFGGVTGLMAAVIDDGGFTIDEAAQVVVRSVANQCPRHWGLLLAYANQGGTRI